MKIKRLCAPNIREAMRKVREELGADAVILSNNRVDNGIEIVAAVDYDARLVQETRPFATETPPKQSVPLKERPAGPANAGSAQAGGESNAPAAPPVREAVNKGSREAEETARAEPDNAKPRVVWSQDPLLVDMQSELKAMRSLLEQQLSGLAWGELARRQPYRADLLKRLLDFGLSSALCMRLADAVSDERDLEQAWKLSLENLARSLTVTQDDILTQGGIVALVGPTGVGKTTTVAKLAARYTLRHGARRVALITTDSYRIGAYDQLRTFGMILDTPVRMAGDHDELRTAIAEFSDKSLILIDTAGMSQRDLRLAQQFALLAKAPQIRSYLVLAANAQASTLKEAVIAFARAQLTGCILTKLDETDRLGGALSVVHGQGLPLAYVSAGQRVPEDLQAARSANLIQLGEELIQSREAASEEDESLALIFGGRVSNAQR